VWAEVPLLYQQDLLLRRRQTIRCAPTRPTCSSANELGHSAPSPPRWAPPPTDPHVARTLHRPCTRIAPPCNPHRIHPSQATTANPAYQPASDCKKEEEEEDDPVIGIVGCLVGLPRHSGSSGSSCSEVEHHFARAEEGLDRLDLCGMFACWAAPYSCTCLCWSRTWPSRDEARRASRDSPVERAKRSSSL
jgi:hypothetical protein